MRLESLLQRHLPDGGRVADTRPAAQRARMSFAADSRIAVDHPEAGDPLGPVVVTDAADLTDRPLDGRALTVVVIPDTGPGEGPVPDVLAWAGNADGQVVEITRLLAPPVIAVVVRHGADPEVPTIPARAEPLPATPHTWKRLAGELLLERHRAAVREGEVDRLQADVVKLKRALKKERNRNQPQSRRRMPWPPRRSGGDGA